jgi:membrane associated rhomboid family serine protease
LDIENEKIERRAQNTAVTGPFILSYTPIVISDAQPKARIPYITIAIITLCTGIFLAQAALITDYDTYFALYGFTPSNISLTTLFTSIFLHGSITHLLGNMYYLWIFGDNVEDKIGHFTYLGWYLLFGIFASLLALIFRTNTNIPHIGASGAISGILGAYYIFYPHSKLKVFWINSIQKLSASTYILIWFILQIINSLVNQNSGVAWTTHIMGCILGAATAYSYKKLSHLD